MGLFGQWWRWPWSQSQQHQLHTALPLQSFEILNKTNDNAVAKCGATDNQNLLANNAESDLENTFQRVHDNVAKRISVLELTAPCHHGTLPIIECLTNAANNRTVTGVRSPPSSGNGSVQTPTLPLIRCAELINDYGRCVSNVQHHQRHQYEH